METDRWTDGRTGERAGLARDSRVESESREEGREGHTEGRGEEKKHRRSFSTLKNATASVGDRSLTLNGMHVWVVEKLLVAHGTVAAAEKHVGVLFPLHALHAETQEKKRHTLGLVLKTCDCHFCPRLFLFFFLSFFLS